MTKQPTGNPLDDNPDPGRPYHLLECSGGAFSVIAHFATKREAVACLADILGKPGRDAGLYPADYKIHLKFPHTATVLEIPRCTYESML